MKKKWEKPKLIVLVRGMSEENILALCKGSDDVGPTGDYGKCKFTTVTVRGANPPEYSCGDFSICRDWAPS